MNTSEKNMSDKPTNQAKAKNAKGLENGKKPTNPENFRDMDGLDSATILETFDAATILATYPLGHGPREGETIRNRNIPKHRTRARARAQARPSSCCTAET